MTAPLPERDAAEVQRLPLLGYLGDASRHLVLRIADAAAARQGLKALLDTGQISFGRAAQRLAGVDVGFTFRGLRALGADDRLLAALQQRAPAFAEGAVPRATRRLGDAGANAPAQWDAAFAPDRAHVLLAVHGADRGGVNGTVATLRGRLAPALEGWDDGRFDADHLPAPGRPPGARIVHFGYRDNITRPSVLVAAGDPRAHAGGELLVGHVNDVGFDPWLGTPAPVGDALRNASFCALRLIEQDVAGFEEDLTRHGRELGPPVTTDYLKAKLCGRWTNGVRVEAVHGFQMPPGAHSFDADFDRFPDRDGTGCPFGSHIRRTNPRLEEVPPRKRPLFRRGMPYGGPFDPQQPDAEPRGLVGLFFCASLEDQFEHVLAEWVEKMPMGPPSSGRAKDPLIGHHTDPAAEFHIPRPDAAPLVLRGLRSFARTRGTLYACFPSRSGLKHLTSGGTP